MRTTCFSALAEVIGQEAALSLSQQLGGTEWYIGADIPEAHPITQIIGQVRARALAERMAGVDLGIPQNPRTRTERNAEIVRRVAAGETTREIALALGLSQRMIRYVLSKPPGNVSTDAVGKKST